MGKHEKERTASHYTKQWGNELGFADFVASSPEAAIVLPARQLGWPTLIERIRKEAGQRSVEVYDAACGFGDMMAHLFADPAPQHLHYVGADIRDGLCELSTPVNADLLQHDITGPLPGGRLFDFVICRAALHHTPDPATTYAVLASQLKPGGVLAVSVYARKAPMREAVDDRLRERIVEMSNDEAFAAARQFTLLGRDLQATAGKIRIAQDLPLLGIKAGEYSLQSFIYDHFIKCWFNKKWGEERSDIVNFDWYHPPFAFRFTAEEIVALAAANGLKVLRRASITAQHYLEAQR